MFKYIALKYLNKLSDYYTHQLLSIESELVYADIDDFNLVNVYIEYVTIRDKIDDVINIINN